MLSFPCPPLPSFSPAQMGFTRRRRRRGGSAKRRRPGTLCCERSDAEVFLWLMNGTFEVSSLARCPKPASPVVGVNWPVVCLSGTVPSSLPANLVSVAAQNWARITSTSKSSINFQHTMMYPFTLQKLVSNTINTYANTTNTLLMLSGCGCLI